MLASVPLIDQVWDSVGWWLKGLLIAIVSGVLVAKSVKYVHQNELGLRHFRGKVRKNAQPIKPGWAFHVPFVGGVLKKSVLPQTWQIGVLVPRDGRTWDANYSVTFAVNPKLAYQNWFGHQDPDEYLRTAITSWLWHVLKTAEREPDVVDYVEVERLVIEPAGRALELIGVILLEMRHRWTAETNASQLGSAIKDARPSADIGVAAIASLNGNGHGNSAVLLGAEEGASE
jgi:hypothetical protein